MKRPPWTTRPWLARSFTAVLLAVVLALVVRYARTLDWHEVAVAVATTPASTLLTAAALAAASHLAYSCFDLLGRAYTGHRLPVRRVMAITFISYAFNLNLGSLVGGIALRVRLYTRLGLRSGTVLRVISLSMLTNWLGYGALAGGLCLAAPLPLPAGWDIGRDALRLLGTGLLAGAGLYLVLCMDRGRRSVRVWGRRLALPSARLAGIQLALSVGNWMLMGAMVHVLLQGRLPYALVLSVLLVAAVAGVLAHVPAGLGVLEATFLALLAPRLPESTLLAALLVYRGLYYLAPWAVAGMVYLGLEALLRSPRNLEGCGPHRPPQ